jgi:peptide/nickel transport system substrate-binding protein
MILPKEVADQDGDFRKTAIGTGAFILKEWVPKTKTVHAKNPDYFRKGRPFLDGFEISFVPDASAQLGLYRAGEVHYAYPGLYEMSREQADALLRTHPDTVVLEDVPSRATWGIGVRLDKPPFNDVRVRRAISMALNRTGMIQAFRGANGHILPASNIHDFYDNPPRNEEAVRIWPWLRYDPDAAKRLLAEAGHPNGFSAKGDHFPQTPALGQMTLLAQQDLRRIGIEVEIKTYDAASWNASNPPGPGLGGYDEMVFFGTPPGGGEEMDQYTYLYMNSKSVRNTHRINDPQLDEWTLAQRKEQDPEKRKAIVKQILDRANDQVLGIPFAEQSRIIAHSPKLKFFLPIWVNLWPHWGGQMWEELWLSDK